jgi:aminomethyltransferase
VTSGNFSPTLGKGIALGYVDGDVAGPGTMLDVDVRGKRVPVTVTPPPFIPRGRPAAP